MAHHTNFSAGAASSSSELLTRRHFFGRTSTGIGIAALANLLSQEGLARASAPTALGGRPELPHFAPRAKRVIFLFQSGAPSQIETFDYKPALAERQGEELPESIRRGQRLTTMTADQTSKPLTPSCFAFDRYGQSGTYVSELLPATAAIVDDLCLVRSVFTEAINHDPAITFLQTGSQQPGRPSMGAWISYGLGTESAALPAFVVFVSGGRPGDQPLFGRLWGSAFLSSEHQAVQFRAGRDPLLYLANPPGIDQTLRRTMLDLQAELNRQQFAAVGDPIIQQRIRQYETAYQLQMAAPELTDLSGESETTLAQYGDDVRTPGSFAAHCLLARRMVERGVRFVQLFHRGWDHHDHLPNRMREKCQQVDQPAAALVSDLKQRGLLDETLVVWAGEFGRTAYCQGAPSTDDYGRDHHPRCFTVWLAGGGVKRGFSYGETDDFSYNVVRNPVHVHDLQATILHLLGIDHERLIYTYQGRDFRLTDIAGRVVHDLLA